MRHVRIEGNAELAEALVSSVICGMPSEKTWKWLFGDIAAHRLVKLRR